MYTLHSHMRLRVEMMTQIAGADSPLVEGEGEDGADRCEASFVASIQVVSPPTCALS